jgi:hypothetical protein
MNPHAIYGVRADDDFVLPCGYGADGLKEALGVLYQELPYGILERADSPDELKNRAGAVLAGIVPQGLHTWTKDGSVWLSRAATMAERAAIGAFSSELAAFDPTQGRPEYATMTEADGYSSFAPFSAGLARKVHQLSLEERGYLVRRIGSEGDPTIIARWLGGVDFLCTVECDESERSTIHHLACALRMSRMVPDVRHIKDPSVKEKILAMLKAIARGTDSFGAAFAAT